MDPVIDLLAMLLGTFIDVLFFFYLIRLIIFKVVPVSEKIKLGITIALSFFLIFYIRLSYVEFMPVFWTFVFYLTFVIIEVKHLIKKENKNESSNQNKPEEEEKIN